MNKHTIPSSCPFPSPAGAALTPIRVVVESVCLGCFIELPLLADALGTYSKSMERVLEWVVCGVVAALALWEVVRRANKVLRTWSLYAFILAVLVMVWYWLTVFNYAVPTVSFFVVAYVLVAFMLPICLQVDVRLWLKAMFILPMGVLPGLRQLFMTPVEQDLFWLGL